MKKRQGILTVFLILITALAGWFLPSVAAAVSEQAVTKSVITLDFAPVSLDYSQELHLVDKFSSIEHGNYSYSLSKGVFLQEADAKQIANSFLNDFLQENGNGTATATIWQSDDLRVFVIWLVDLSTPSGSYAHFKIDDATGVILSMQLVISDSFWETALDSTQGLEKALTEQYIAAYNTHLKQQDVSLSCRMDTENKNSLSEVESYYSLLLQDEVSQQFCPLLRISRFNGIGFNPEYGRFYLP